MAKDKKKYETFGTIYEGASGDPWVAFLKSKESEGWALLSAQVVKQIDDKHFQGKVVFRREIKGGA